MSTTPTTTPITDRYHIPADRVLNALRDCGVTHVFTVPDFITLSVHRLLLDGYLPEVRTVECCSEDEAIAAAAGAWIGGAVPIVVMQNQGLHACVNNLRALGVDARIPIVMLIGQFGREPENLGHDPAESRRATVRVSEPILNALGIPNFRLEQSDDLSLISTAYEIAQRDSVPTALLVGAATAWTN
jgi:sulfopyruvate decarboxylase TPP-binding subunit